MNLLNQLRFGGVFGGVNKFSRSTAIESEGVVVRPSGFEPPTFCSGDKRSIAEQLTRFLARHRAAS